MLNYQYLNRAIEMVQQENKNDTRDLEKARWAWYGGTSHIYSINKGVCQGDECLLGNFLTNGWQWEKLNTVIAMKKAGQNIVKKLTAGVSWDPDILEWATEYARANGVSRSAVIHAALTLLREVLESEATGLGESVEVAPARATSISRRSSEDEHRAKTSP